MDKCILYRGYWTTPQGFIINITTPNIRYDIEPGGDIRTLKMDLLDDTHLIVHVWPNLQDIDLDCQIDSIPWEEIGDINIEAESPEAELIYRIMKLENTHTVFQWVYGEVALVSGSVLVCANKYHPGYVKVFKNGVRLSHKHEHYTLNPTPFASPDIILAVRPELGDEFILDYVCKMPLEHETMIY